MFKIDKPTVFDLYAYDAGTEQNESEFACPSRARRLG